MTSVTRSVWAVGSCWRLVSFPVPGKAYKRKVGTALRNDGISVEVTRPRKSKPPYRKILRARLITLANERCVWMAVLECGHQVRISPHVRGKKRLRCEACA